MISSSSWIWSTKIFPFLVHFQIFPFLTHKEWSDSVVTYLEMIVTSFRVEWRIVWHDWPSSLKVRIFPFSKKIFPFFKKFPKKNFWKKNFPFFEKKNFQNFSLLKFLKNFSFFSLPPANNFMNWNQCAPEQLFIYWKNRLSKTRPIHF